MKKKYLVIASVGVFFLLIISTCSETKKNAPNAPNINVCNRSYVTNENAPNISIPDNEKLYITEVGSRKYSNEFFWFEIYNPQPVSINLKDYQMGALCLTSGNILIPTTFNLPNLELPAGNYMIIRANFDQNGDGRLDGVDSTHMLHIGTIAKTFYIGSKGFIEIIKSGNTVDFVSFGDRNNILKPSTATEWSGDTASALPREIGQSLARKIGSSGLIDTNSAADWNLSSFPTFGGPNDVTCDTDKDQDGIPDCSELSGSTFAGIDLYALGSRKDQKDIFIEVDYMRESNNPGVTPKKEALVKVKEKFAEHQIFLHFDVGDLYGPRVDDFNLGGGQEVPYHACTQMNQEGKNIPATCQSLYQHKAQYFGIRRKQIFHYMFFANSQKPGGTAGSGGVAEVHGNDSIITLGKWFDSGSLEQMIINVQASTIMHELGHNLNLRHGGHEDENFKPNYLSIMNYLYQRGLSTIGTNEGDRYKWGRYSIDKENDLYNQCFNKGDILTKDFTTPDFIMDFSDGSGGNLNENAVSESEGLGRNGSIWVDFNCDGQLNLAYKLDLNEPYSRSKNPIETEYSELKDHNDWENLKIVFQKTFASSLHGPSLDSTMAEQKISLMNQTIGNDRATEIIVEDPPSPEFLEALRNHE